MNKDYSGKNDLCEEILPNTIQFVFPSCFSLFFLNALVSTPSSFTRLGKVVHSWGILPPPTMDVIELYKGVFYFLYSKLQTFNDEASIVE